MSNQMIHWFMFVVPWLTLFFMKREDIKRYMPAALFATVLTTIILDVGITLGFWVVRESVFPFNELFPYYLGLALVLTMWVLNFSYGRFGVYMVINLILDTGFNFLLLDYFLPNRGIFGLFGITPLQGMPITLMHAVLIYGYQMWQEGIFVRSERTNASPSLQPAAAKPLGQDQDDNTNNK